MADGDDLAGMNLEEARQGCRPSLVNKNFLHSNSTSHEWMFGAIAEILDNATDPDVLATQFWVDVEIINNEKCLVLTDNGLGMDNNTLYRMLSFGFSEKEAVNGHKPIGRYGNGFKSGSMRLAKDALVFTIQNKKTMSVGMLSQTYLEKTKSDTVVVPIVTWHWKDATIQYPRTDEKTSLAEILKYSIFKSEDQLVNQIYKIPPKSNKHQGTRIVLYNLAKDKYGQLELDFDSVPDDILIPSNQQEMDQLNVRDKSKSLSKYRTSLRKYISILYLRPRMQVILKRKKVSCICMLKCLSNMKRYVYTPKKITKDPIYIDFGLNPEKDEYGILIYHRNRLIQPFRKNNFMKKSLPENVGPNQIREVIDQVVGVVSLDCVTPNHIKQNFQDDIVFRNIDQNLVGKLWDYCVETVQSNDERDKELDLWVQCCHPDCQKWRRLPQGLKKVDLPELWYCMMNPDPLKNFCDAQEEEEDDVEIQRPKKKVDIPPSEPNVIPSTSGTSVRDSENEEEEQRPAVLSPKMMGVVNQIMITCREPHLKPRKRRRISTISNTPSKKNCLEVRPETPPETPPEPTPASPPTTSTNQFPCDDTIRHLRLELDSKQARIAELEQQLEKLNSTANDDVVIIPNDDEQARHARIESLVIRYVSKIWPDFDPKESMIELVLEQLVTQMENLQQEKETKKEPSSELEES